MLGKMWIDIDIFNKYLKLIKKKKESLHEVENETGS